MNDGETNDTQGSIFSIQRFSLQDGPGIRTTVFLKGCPLKCRWCSNPESQQTYPELMFRRQKCRSCGTCAETCDRHAIDMKEGFPFIDRKACDRCMACVAACPSGAMEITGETMSAAEAAEEACRDEVFYGNSGGGVTLSGGEPLSQPEFARSLLKYCKERSVRTALDTSGHAPWSALEAVLPFSDLVLFDLKHLDPDSHTLGTGAGNERILENLERLFERAGTRIWIRIPVIPGYNDGEACFRDLASYLEGKPFEKVSLLGYHQWGKSKYVALGRGYPCAEQESPSKEHLEQLSAMLKARGITVSVDH